MSLTIRRPCHESVTRPVDEFGSLAAGVAPQRKDRHWTFHCWRYHNDAIVEMHSNSVFYDVALPHTYVLIHLYFVSETNDTKDCAFQRCSDEQMGNEQSVVLLLHSCVWTWRGVGGGHTLRSDSKPTCRTKDLSDASLRRTGQVFIINPLLLTNTFHTMFF